MTIKTTLKNKNNLKIIIVLTIVFFFVYSFYSFQFPDKFNSPDEGANFFFINHFIQNSSFSLNEPLNVDLDSLIHPRNTKSNVDSIIPYSFLGLYLVAGFFGKLFTAKIIYFIVPFFSSLAVVFFYLGLKKIFPEKTAFISSLLLFIHPAFWYLASLPFYHNALFASFLIISFYFLIATIENGKVYNYIFLALSLGLTIMTRTSEILWISILLLAIFVLTYKKWNKKKLVLALVCFLIFISPMLYFNHQTYGDYLTVGYLSTSSSSNADTASGIANNVLVNNFSKIFFPKGLVVDKLYETISKYLVNIYLIFSLLCLLGFIFILFTIKPLERKQRLYYLSFAFISLYLILYYGSGSFFGAQEGDSGTTVASSFVRYWLPIYIFSIPFIAIFIIKFSNLLKNSKLRIIFIALIFSILFFTSINIVYLDKDSGLDKLNDNSVLYSEITQELYNYINEEDIVITTSTDKFIFPEFNVIALNNYLENYTEDEKRMSTIRKVLENKSVYYFTIYGIDYQETNKLLRPQNLTVSPVATIRETTSLYKFDLITK